MTKGGLTAKAAYVATFRLPFKCKVAGKPANTGQFQVFPAMQRSVTLKSGHRTPESRPNRAFSGQKSPEVPRWLMFNAFSGERASIPSRSSSTLALVIRLAAFLMC